MSRFEAPPGIVTNGLALNLDPGDPDSYTRLHPLRIEVLVVAGGGGGGGNNSNNYRSAGGGGGGGVIYNSAYQLTSAAAITVTVGAGAAGAQRQASSGDNSVFGSLTAIGGGGGGGTTSTGDQNGLDGGSGGGGGDYNGNGGNGTAGQGFRGGNSRQAAGVGAGASGGGGGGAGGPGPDCINSYSQISGGSSITYSISGTSTAYAAGGASLSAADTANPAGASGGANTGTGGQGARFNVGGNGGSGIVIVRYPGLPAATGGIITYVNGYTIHKFTSSGTFTPYKINDVTGNGNDGTLINGTGFVPYINGGVIDFDGADDAIDTDSLTGTNLEFLSNPTVNGNILTWSIWSFNESASSYYLMSTGAQTSSTGIAISYQAGNPFISYQSNDKAMSVNPGVANWPLNEWIQWAFTSNGTNWIVYKNGTLHNSGTLGSNSVTDTQTILRLGGPNNSTCCRFNGKIGSVLAYDRALSSTEILQNFNAQRARFGI